MIGGCAYFSMYTKHAKEIYSADLTLNKANTNNEHCLFLDLDIYVFNGKLNAKIYDKIDDFSFQIVNYPFLETSPCHHLMVFIYFNLFDSIVYVTTYLISMKKFLYYWKIITPGFLISQTS